METINGSDGLCLTCNNAPSCFHRARRGPALFCELFDDSVPAFVRSVRAADSQSSGWPKPALAADGDATKYAGLCMNCRHRTTCAPSRTTGGIWHCENYE